MSERQIVLAFSEQMQVGEVIVCAGRRFVVQQILTHEQYDEKRRENAALRERHGHARRGYVWGFGSKQRNGPGTVYPEPGDDPPPECRHYARVTELP